MGAKLAYHGTGTAKHSRSAAGFEGLKTILAWQSLIPHGNPFLFNFFSTPFSTFCTGLLFCSPFRPCSEYPRSSDVLARNIKLVGALMSVLVVTGLDLLAQLFVDGAMSR